MSRIPLAAACAAVAAAFVGCAAMNRTTVVGSGSIEWEERSVSDFRTVTLAGTGELVVTQGATEDLTIEADGNLLPFIHTEVAGSELTIRWDETVNAKPSRAVRYLLTVKSLEAINLTGSGSLTADEFADEKLTISIAGSADVILNQIRTTELTMSISGSGSLKVSGTTNKFTIKVAGSGDIKAADLKAGEVTVKVAGSGDADVWATDKLTVNVAGSGGVRYKGEPTNVTQSVAGSGSVSRLK